MGFQGEHLQSVVTDDNRCVEIKASVFCLLTPENIIRGNIELSAADVKELFTRDLVNHKGLEKQSSVENTTFKTGFQPCNSFGLAFLVAAILNVWL